MIYNLKGSYLNTTDCKFFLYFIYIGFLLSQHCVFTQNSPGLIFESMQWLVILRLSNSKYTERMFHITFLLSQFFVFYLVTSEHGELKKDFFLKSNEIK